MDARVEKYLNTNIKDIINEFNSVQQELDKFEIGCAPCGLGTCKLIDVIGIHSLNAENEKQLMTQIFSIIYPDESFDIPRLGTDKKPKSKSMCPPLRLLVDEHKLIKRVLALIPTIAGQLNVSLNEHKQLVKDIADFIRNYADKYHHAKEEDILFKNFDNSMEIINVMINDHKLSRGFVAEMLRGVEIENTKLAKENLINYCNLLTEHIQKEDNILYPWMDNNISTRKVGEMYSQFLAINNERAGLREKYEELVLGLETKFMVA